jgi:multisubunit Na+/H+ antiporter MnhE subunit
LAWAALLLAFWIALTDNTQPLDLLVGVGCALIAGTLTEVVRRRANVRPRPRAVWFRQLPRAMWWVVRDSALVIQALATRRPLAGRMVSTPFETGGDDPRAEGRRAFASWVGSAGPNSYVVGLEDDVMAVHQLVPTDEIAPAEVVE